MTIKTFFLALLFTANLSAQTIAEKKAQLKTPTSDLPAGLDVELESLNTLRTQESSSLKDLYSQAWSLYENNASTPELEKVLKQIREKQTALHALDTSWQKSASQNDVDDPYALWHQPQTTVEQLVFDYGSDAYVFLIPPDVGAQTISVNSSLPIPRSAWPEMLELILQENGVEVVTLSPYLKKLQTSKERLTPLRQIINREEALLITPPNERILYLLTPDPTELRRTQALLEKIKDPATTHIQQIGPLLAIAAPAHEVQELLKGISLILRTAGQKEYSLLPLCKLSAEEMAKMLTAVFDQTSPLAECKDPCAVDAFSGLQVLLLPNLKHALFLIGSQNEIRRAEEIVWRIESQICDARGKTIYWYTVRHSDPEELADVLEKIYNLMVTHPEKPQDKVDPCCETPPACPAPQTTDQLYPAGFFQAGDVVVNPAPVGISPLEKSRPNSGRSNFIVDPKTSSIVMVVERDLLARLKGVLSRLDVPKKMVQIEVLLFEKRTADRNHFGLNLLAMGSAATQTHATGLLWNDPLAPIRRGVLDFFVSRPKQSGIPAFDLSYNFLISQDDVQINASPSVLTLNQTPAQIAIVEELSINTGIYDVETAKGVTLKDSFTRAQYGTTLNITPTIHMPEEDEEGLAYITLDTKVNFDTVEPRSLQPDRPDVTRRQITNQATVPDGQSVIIGGLRRKVTKDRIDKIPFFGELPCFGKLFCTTELDDRTTEMFIMITPKIIDDPKEDLLEIRREEMQRRPGDIPEYLCRLVAARACARKKLFEGTLTMILGRHRDRCHSPDWHIDDDL